MGKGTVFSGGSDMTQGQGTATGSAPTDAAARQPGTGFAGLLVLLAGLAGIYPGIQLVTKGGHLRGGDSAYAIGLGAAALFVALLSIFSAALVANRRPSGRNLGIVVAVIAAVIGALVSFVRSPTDATVFDDPPIVPSIWSLALLILGVLALVALLASLRHFRKA